MIIGRKRELEILEDTYSSKRAEFIAIYGRRRIGKTYLIREFFTRKECRFFHVTGLQHGTMKKQLEKFTQALSLTFFQKAPLAVPKKWDEAFRLLHDQIVESQEKIVLFLDELPWLATRKSGLLMELDYYWNCYWSAMPWVILVVCGSSASWLIQKIIYNKGGSHNRVTAEIRLLPFSLTETNLYLQAKKINLTQRHVLELYMALGGVPYYLEYIKGSLTSAQNIQRLIFEDNAPLKDEYAKLFDSLFENSDAYKELVVLISKKSCGMDKQELAKQASLSKSGGRLLARLKDLVAAGFIQEHVPWQQSVNTYYKLIDEFCLFYLYWVAPHKGAQFGEDYWLDQSRSPSYDAWSGYAFEALCHKHVRQIIRALDIRTSTIISSWRTVPQKKMDTQGAQIDLIIDRSDDALNLFEIKYTEKPFSMDKAYAAKLNTVVELFRKKTKTVKQIFLSIVSANGLKKTMYSEELVTGVVTLNDLFNS